MTRRAKGWLIASAAFTLVNVAGAVMAAIQLEPMHAATHVALAALGALVALGILGAHRRVALATPMTFAVPAALDDRLTQLEQSLEGLATGVERVGEGQRFINHMFVDDATPVARSGDERAAPR